MDGSLYNKNVLWTVGDASALHPDVQHCELEHCEGGRERKTSKEERKPQLAASLLVSGVSLFGVGNTYNRKPEKKKKKVISHMLPLILYNPHNVETVQRNNKFGRGVFLCLRLLRTSLSRELLHIVNNPLCILSMSP